MLNIKETIFSQYANSPKILALISMVNDAIDPRYDIEQFYKQVFNIMTATDYGLDNWGRIIGVNRVVRMNPENSRTFGFYTDPDSPNFTPFNVAPFYSTGTSFSSYSLPNELYRKLLIVKAISNIIYATAQNINKFLKEVFNKRAYYLITGTMQAEYIFEFSLTSFERLIVYTLGLLPNPCGVAVKYIEQPITDTFGFNGSGLQPFNQGTFSS